MQPFQAPSTEVLCGSFQQYRQPLTRTASTTDGSCTFYGETSNVESVQSTQKADGGCSASDESLNCGEYPASNRANFTEHNGGIMPEVRFRVRLSDALPNRERGTDKGQDHALYDRDDLSLHPSAGPCTENKPHAQPNFTDTNERAQSDGERRIKVTETVALHHVGPRTNMSTNEWIATHVDPFLRALREALARDRPTDVSEFVSGFVARWHEAPTSKSRANGLAL